MGKMQLPVQISVFGNCCFCLVNKEDCTIQIMNDTVQILNWFYFLLLQLIHLRVEQKRTVLYLAKTLYDC